MAEQKDPDAEPGADRMFVTALARGLQILRTFSAQTPELGTSDLARLTKLPQPTVWRLCHTLAELGFLTRVPGTDKLRLGIPVLGLGYAILTSYPIAELARPYMQEIASRYHGAVSLGARDGINMVYLQRCVGSAIVLGDLRIGSMVSLAYSATGWAYLSALTPAERKPIYAEIQAADGARWKKVKPLLDAALNEARTTGYIVSRGVLHPDIHAVSVPIRSASGAPPMAMSSGGIRQIFTDDVLAKVGRDLVALAEQLSVWADAQADRDALPSQAVAAL